MFRRNPFEDVPLRRTDTLRPPAKSPALPAALFTALVLTTVAPTLHAADKPDFGGRTPLDLSDGQVPLPTTGATPMKPRHNRAQLPASGCGEEARGQMHWVGEDDPAAERRAEALRIKAQAATVSRKDDTLVVTPKQGAALAFTDWRQVGRADAEGDSRAYYYAETLPGSGYLRIEEHFGHDAPASYLIEPTSGALAYVHNGGQVGALSPDGKRVATFEMLNDPFRLVLAALTPDGPRREVECRFQRSDPAIRASACGWLSNDEFEIAWQAGEGKPISYRYTVEPTGWRVTIAAPKPLVPVTCVAIAP